VWEYQPSENTWKPTLVILRIEKGAIDVKWSMDGLRFAATSGAKCVSVCTYEAQNDWWVSKMVRKKFKSTVLCCAFHPQNGQLLATVSGRAIRIHVTLASPLSLSSFLLSLPCSAI
jgi:actin related protein 2/3 complex, subunit 1A/1B